MRDAAVQCPALFKAKRSAVRQKERRIEGEDAGCRPSRGTPRAGRMRTRRATRTARDFSAKLRAAAWRRQYCVLDRHDRPRRPVLRAGITSESVEGSRPRLLRRAAPGLALSQVSEHESRELLDETLLSN